MLFAADIGHNRSKICYSNNYDEIDTFRSTIKLNTRLMSNSSSTNVIIDNKNWVIGTAEGTFSSEDDKSKDNVFHLCLLTGIAKNMKRNIDTVQLVTGLPMNYYKLYNNQLIEKYYDKRFDVIIKGTTKTLHFTDICVYPESYGYQYISSINEDHMIIDIGGATVDVSLFVDDDLIQGQSYDLGINKLYGYMADRINKQYGTDYNIAEIERSVANGTLVYDNKTIDIDYTDFLKNHLDIIVSNIKNDFPWKKSVKSFIGGGALLYKDYLMPKFTVNPYANLMNARAFYELGKENGY